MPEHEWSGTELRFEIEPGVWGEWVDLEGPAGKDGQSGPQIGVYGGGPIDVSKLAELLPPTNSYFPSGW